MVFCAVVGFLWKKDLTDCEKWKEGRAVIKTNFLTKSVFNIRNYTACSLMTVVSDVMGLYLCCAVHMHSRE